MQRELKLPDVGEGIAEGEIVNWLVEPGDQVTEDQAVAEVETDKAMVEVPSPVSGTVETLHASEGDVVEVGTVIVTFEIDEDSTDGSTAAESESDTPETGAETSPDATSDAGSTADGQSAGDAASADQSSPATTDGETVPASQVIAPPRVKRLARELGVEIGALDGAGDGTHITEAAVRQAAGDDEPLDQRAATPTESGETVTEHDRADDEESTGSRADTTTARSDTAKTTGAADREKTLAAPATRQLATELGVDIDAVPASEERDGQPFVTAADVRSYASGDAAEASTTSRVTSAAGESRSSGTDTAQAEERIPYRGIRRTIGERMAETKYTAPHVSHHDEVDVSELAAVREELNRELADDVSLTYLPFVMQAVVEALQEHPELNASLDEENEAIVQKHYYHIGVATATDAGLMVPVVRDVDQKGLAELAREIERVVESARSREIDPSEMQNSTFTVTNFGAIGGNHATPIINYPEAAILGLGAIEERPTVVDGEVVARTTLPLSLTVDHRLVDGADAASFTNDVKRYLNNPSLLML